MSSSTFNQRWLNAKRELKRQLEIERQWSGEPGEGETAATKHGAVSIDEAFRHFSRLYVNYLRIFRELEQCYDSIVQPQKRIDIRETLELVIARVIDLRHILVKWNPPNPDVRVRDGGAKQPPFPWEYVDLSETLRELQIPPSSVEVTVPRYFKEDHDPQHRQRDAMVEGYMKLKLGKDSVDLDDVDDCAVVGGGDDEDIRVVEGGAEPLNDTGATAVSSSDSSTSSEDESPDHEDSSSDEDEHLESDDAAVLLQSWTRGSFVRAQVERDKQEEGAFIGMRLSGHESLRGALLNSQRDSYTRRKQEQHENQEAYERALMDLKDTVLEEEGFEMRERLREARVGWVTDCIARTSVIPDSLEDFYKPPPAVPGADGDAAGGNADASKGKKGSKKDGKKAGGEKSKKEKGKADKGADANDVETPSLQGPLHILNSLSESVDTFEGRWEQSLLKNVHMSEKHDPELAKNLIIRGQVESELTKIVDDTLVSNLKKVKELHASGKGGKGKKGGKAKKGKGKKGKKGKKGGGKKEKPLPGEKLTAMKKMDSAHMLSVLIEHKLVNNPRSRKISELHGTSNAPHQSLLQNSTPDDTWLPQDPTMRQLRSAITEYCILPNGSSEVKERIDDAHNVRSLLFYGPGGSGKTSMVEAVASSLGALFINLSPKRLVGKFADKSGATQLVHMAFTVAKDPSFAPVVIYLDECEEFFLPLSKKKKGPVVDKNGPVRFQKDLLIYKNQALKKDDRVIIIGCSKNPDAADLKVLKWKGPSGKPEKQGFFEKFLYFPVLHYPERYSLLENLITDKLKQVEQLRVRSKLDYGSLALHSEGCTAGNMEKVIADVLTADRMQSVPAAPLAESEFIDKFHSEVARVSQEDLLRFMDFTRKVTDLEARKKALEAPAGKENNKKNANKKKK